jgi:uncharacterized repeat protein (TIGR03803 family)
VTLDKEGNLYGTTGLGGNGFGTVFQLTPTRNGWSETLLQSFNESDGGYPDAGLISDDAGNLYGATSDGGPGNSATVFELSFSGGVWTLQTLYAFPAGPHSCGPRASLSMDTVGNLYGTTFCDGTNGWGNVWELVRSGSGWMYKDLYDFTGGGDGASPLGAVTVDANGNLYGTAYAGGSQGHGTVWEITP